MLSIYSLIQKLPRDHQSMFLKKLVDILDVIAAINGGIRI
jgi:hypothetical protein